jgi:integrase
MHTQLITTTAPIAFDIANYSRSTPDTSPVDRYLGSLSAGSEATMLQALGVVTSLLTGAGRPDTTVGQKREQRKATAEALRQAARDFDWFALSDRQAEAFLLQLAAQGYAASSQAKMIAAVVGVLGACQTLLRRQSREALQAVTEAGQASVQTIVPMQAVDNARMGSIAGAVDVLREYTPQAPAGASDEEAAAAAAGARALSDDEVELLALACAKRGAIGARDMAILALGIGGGLRRSEIAALRFDDITWADQYTAKRKPYLTARVRHGKGDKFRVIMLLNGSREALLQWRRVRGDDKGPLLYAFHKGTGMVVDQSIDAQTVYNVCQETAAAAGIAPFAPHDMRRTMVSNMIAATGDVAMASKQAGHSNIQTTMGYDMRGAALQAAAVDVSSHFPFMAVTIQPSLAAD